MGIADELDTTEMNMPLLTVRRASTWRFSVLRFSVLGLSVLSLAACVLEEGSDRRRFDDDETSSTSSEEGSVAASSGGGITTGVGGGSSSSSEASSSSSASSSSASTSTGSGGSNCNDPYDEPNESEFGATLLSAMSDCDDEKMLSGVLAGNDVDWFVYSGSDDAFCSVAPSRSITADGQARVCQFFDCAGSVVTCEGGSTFEESPGMGLPGCCSLSPFSAQVDCDGISDDADVYIRVDKPPAFQCVSYDLEFQY